MSAIARMAAVTLALVLLATPVPAVDPNEMLADPALEARARDISKVLRCVLCRNQSIDDSNAGIARSMRVVLRERLALGDSDDQAVQFLVDRYGDFVLLDPPVKPVTYLLWAGPGLLLIVAVFGFARFWQSNAAAAKPAEPDLSAEDEARLADLLAWEERT